jgi:thiamine kinase-like enzyme
MISHRDLTTSNVVWHKGQPYLVDWEMAGAIHRTKDVIATALNWSLSSQYQVKNKQLTSFLETYSHLNQPLLLSDIEISLHDILDDWMSWIIWNEQLWLLKKLHSLQCEILQTAIAIIELRAQFSTIMNILRNYAK